MVKFGPNLIFDCRQTNSHKLNLLKELSTQSLKYIQFYINFFFTFFFRINSYSNFSRVVESLIKRVYNNKIKEIRS